MSIIFFIAVIILTCIFYIIMEKKFKKPYTIIYTSIFLIVILSISGLWWFFPRHVTIIDTADLQIQIELPSEEATSINDSKKEEWIDLIENTQFFKGDPGYLLQKDRLTNISFLGRHMKIGNHKITNIYIYVFQDEKYGIADIDGKRYRFHPDTWKQKIQEGLLQ